MQSEEGGLDANDGLLYYFSGDGGNTWSAPMVAFADDIGSTAVPFAISIPVAYRTNEFRIRYEVLGFDEPGQFCYIDDIIIGHDTENADMKCLFAIDPGDGWRWVYHENGTPTYQLAKPGINENDKKVSAYGYDLLDTDPGGDEDWYYASVANVTDLVKANFDPATDPSPIKFKVSNVYAHEGDTSQMTFAGWSLVLIYQSPQTLDHKIYVYDPTSLGVFYVDNYPAIGADECEHGVDYGDEDCLVEWFDIDGNGIYQCNPDIDGDCEFVDKENLQYGPEVEFTLGGFL